MHDVMITVVIPKQQLEELGFIELQDNLFIKALGDGVSLYRDYRGPQPSTYAYKRGKTIDHKNFKETRAIEVIEESVGVGATDSNSLSSYDNQISSLDFYMMCANAIIIS